jgi:hypothetical protein
MDMIFQVSRAGRRVQEMVEFHWPQIEAVPRALIELETLI